jgi:hypothetical protein
MYVCTNAMINTSTCTYQLLYLILTNGVLDRIDHYYMYITDTVKPVHAATSIKQPPVLKGHPLLVWS